MRRSCISDFRSSSTIPTATNKFGDLEIFAKPQKNGAILIQDFATFIQAIGKVHYLAANSEVRKEKVKEEYGVIKIPLGIALDWLGSSKAFSVDSIFPPPAFDTGWRDLMFRDEVAVNKVFKQRV